MMSRRVAIVVLLALVAASAISAVSGDESSQEHALDAAAAVRRELRGRGFRPGGSNNSSGSLAALLGGSSLAFVIAIGSLVAAALFQDI